MDAVPAAATEVKDMEPRRVSRGEGDGVSFGADGLDECAVFDSDAEMALENHGSSRLDNERLQNAYVTGHEDRVGFPCTILYASDFYVLGVCKENAKRQ